MERGKMQKSRVGTFGDEYCDSAKSGDCALTDIKYKFNLKLCCERQLSTSIVLRINLART
jgi:hypothetical protein